MTDTSAATLGRALARSGKYSGGSSSVVADFALPPKPADDETAGHSAEPDIPLPPEPPSDDANSDGGRRSVAARLVDLTLADFTLGVSDTDEPFAVPKARPHIAMPLRGGKTGYRPELARRFYDAHGTVPPAQALTDATSVLEGKAAAQTPQRLHLRAALADGVVYLDTGDTAARVIRITGGSWEVVDTAPVLFRRTKLTGAMADPRHGGDLTRLWEFAPIAEADRPVTLAVLVHALIDPDTPHVVFALLAEQGLTKSSTTRALVDLIDPSPVPLRQAPRDPESWVTAASASYAVALDNLSAIPAWLSDSLCRASTGDGSVKRALYTDGDVSVTQFRRCVLLNGIDLGALRGDLAERMAAADLDRIPAHRRRPEAELTAAWTEARPVILGGLLDLAARVHQRLPTQQLARAPRMADFARVLAAVDAELGTAGLDRYRERAGRMAADSLTADEFISRLLAQRHQCTGDSAGQILDELTPTDKDWRRPREWPRNPRAVTSLLKRHAPALRELGWTVTDDGGHNKTHAARWTITPPDQSRETASPGSPTSSQQVRGHESGEVSDEVHNSPSSLGEVSEEPARNTETDTSPHLPSLNSADEPASKASNKYASALLPTEPPCRLCREPLTTAKSLARGLCAECRLTQPEGLPA